MHTTSVLVQPCELGQVSGESERASERGSVSDEREHVKWLTSVGAACTSIPPTMAVFPLFSSRPAWYPHTPKSAAAHIKSPHVIGDISRSELALLCICTDHPELTRFLTAPHPSSWQNYTRHQPRAFHKKPDFTVKHRRATHYPSRAPHSNPTSVCQSNPTRLMHASHIASAFARLQTWTAASLACSFIAVSTARIPPAPGSGTTWCQLLVDTWRVGKTAKKQATSALSIAILAPRMAKRESQMHQNALVVTSLHHSCASCARV